MSPKLSNMDWLIDLGLPILVGGTAVHYKLGTLGTEIWRNYNGINNLKYDVKYLKKKADEEDKVEQGRDEVRQKLAKHITLAKSA